MAYDYKIATSRSVAERAPVIMKDDAIMQTPPDEDAGRTGREIACTGFLEGLRGGRCAVKEVKVCVYSGGNGGQNRGAVMWNLLFDEQNMSTLR